MTSSQLFTLSVEVQHASNIHINISNAQGYVCPTAGCHRRFQFKIQLTRHLVTHKTHRVRQWICPDPTCDWAFRRPAHLRRHLYKVHKEEFEFTCGPCREVFIREETYRNHNKKKHPLYCAALEGLL